MPQTIQLCSFPSSIMFSTSQKRLFRPLPDNPLHGYESSSEGSRMLVDSVSPQQSSLDTSPKNHHGSGSDPLPQVKPSITQTQSDKDPISPMKLMPAFLLVPLAQVEEPGVVPVIPFVSGFPQSPSRPNSEIITRANLMPLMLSKGIITSPDATIPPATQPHNLISSKPQYTQHFPLPFNKNLSAPSFPDNHIVIQVAQPPAAPDISPNDSSSGFEHIPPKAEYTINNKSDAVQPVPATKDYISPNGKQAGHHFSDPQKKIPARRQFSSYKNQQSNLPYQQQRQLYLEAPRNAKLKAIDWKNHLSRLWFLLERGDYNNKEHQNLLFLLSEMNKTHLKLTLEWLKRSKVVEYLKKFEKAESMYNYDPSVRKMVGTILQDWSKKFPI